MKTATRQKATRHLVSALLSGVFSDREVAEISSALVRRDDFVIDLGFALRDVAEQLSGQAKTGRSQITAGKRRPRTTPAEQAGETVSTSGITQRELLHIISEISPGFALSLRSKRLSTAGILARFFRDHGDDQRAALMKVLAARSPAAPKNGDSYLDLITRKLER